MPNHPEQPLAGQTAPAPSSDVPVREGLIPFKCATTGKTYTTWYRVFGQLPHPTRRPLIVVHGGPGLSHDYLLPLQDLATSRPVIFYDQLGTARSTHIHDQPETFWTYELFIDELVNLVAFFEIGKDFDLLGHSWGGMLGAEFVLRRKPAGLNKLILSNSLAAHDMWNESTEQQLAEFPQDIQETVRAGPYADRKKYREAMAKFEAVHMCTVQPRPKEIDISFDYRYAEDGDMTVGDAMYVRPVRSCSSCSDRSPIRYDTIRYREIELNHWSIIDKLHEIKVPTFVINAPKDTSQDWLNEPYFLHIPKVKWVSIQNATHMPFWEVRERYMELVNDFLEY